MKKTKIIGILIRDRIKEAGKLQILLSSHNEIIRSRLGFTSFRRKFAAG